MTSLEEAQKLCTLAAWEVYLLGEMVSLLGEILHQFREGREEEVIYLLGFSPTPNRQTLHLEHLLSHTPGLLVAASDVRSHVLWRAFHPSLEIMGGDKLDIWVVSARVYLILYIRCVQNSLILFSSFIRRGNLA